MNSIAGSKRNNFVQFINNIMLYICDKADYVTDLGICRQPKTDKPAANGGNEGVASSRWTK